MAQQSPPHLSRSFNASSSLDCPGIIIGKPCPTRHLTPDTPPQAPRNGEFLLQLLQQGRKSSSLENASLQPESDTVDEQAAWHIRDPAVAALGPSHPLSQSAASRLDIGLRLQDNQHLANSSPLGWSVPSSTTTIDASFPSAADVPFHPSLDRFLPSPLDPLFRPAANQSFRNTAEHLQHNQYQYSQFSGGLHPSMDHHHPYMHHPASPMFSTHAGISNSKRVQEFPWSNSLSPQRLPGELECWPGSEKGLSSSTVRLPQSFPQFCSNGAEIIEYLGGSHAASYAAVPSLNRSQFEEVSFTGGEPLNPNIIGCSKGGPAKNHGPIGPLKRDEKPPVKNLTEGLGHVWTAAHPPPCRLKGRDSTSKFGLCHQEVCKPNPAHGIHSESAERLVADVPDRTVKGKTESGLSIRGAPFDLHGEGVVNKLHSQRCTYQEDYACTSTMAGWEVWNAPKNDLGITANHSVTQVERGLDAKHWNTIEGLVKDLELVESMHETGTHNKSKVGKNGGRAKVDPPKKGSYKNSSGQWVAVSRDKEADEASKEVLEGVGKVELVGNIDFGLSETADKYHFNLPEAALLGRSHEGTAQKPRDDPKKRRGQVQEWRLKQPHAANQAQPSCMDGSCKTKSYCANIEPTKMNGRIESPLLLQLDHLGLPSGTNLDPAPGSATEQSKQALHSPPCKNQDEKVWAGEIEPCLDQVKVEEIRSSNQDLGKEEDEELMMGFVGFLDFDNDNEIQEPSGIAHKRCNSLVTKDFDSDTMQDGLHRVSRPAKQAITRFHKKDSPYRPDMEKFTGQLLTIFQTLIPSEDEEIRRKQLLSSLDDLVTQNWPMARLYLFGSCANAFGVCNSDIDVCLSIDEHSSKPELVLRLADMLRADNMQNVQALTHARVPIVKFTDPATGISCDVCVNNMLAVVNTKLLHDYARIDARLRQLAFMVKHWAKCRQVNETYRGTLSSYAYVLMCIHFLQQRRPAVLPCLQEMEPTYKVTIGKMRCAYYDRVDRLKNFGTKNKETLGELLTSFFEYWAFRHDYSHAVISIRTGGFLSKIEKDWTRRIGNERHLICIEDPFEISHDLGRVVDKHSIRVLREEFQRAAKIMRHNPNPCAALFESYVRDKA